jgi:hypothetical protein
MTQWAQADLDRLGGTGEVRIEPARPDGSVRKGTPIWIVRVGDELYIRSYKGGGGAWFRHATAVGEGRIGGVDVTFVAPGPDDASRAAIDAEYRRKYGSGVYVDAMVADRAAEATLKLLPAS